MYLINYLLRLIVYKERIYVANKVIEVVIINSNASVVCPF